MLTPTHNDAPLPYPRLSHRTRWPGCPLSEEYLIPSEDKPRIFEQLYPFARVPGLEETWLDIHENKKFVLREFKVVREGGMNMLVSPYYYRSGGSVIDWMPLDRPPHDEDDEAPSDDEDEDDEFDSDLVFDDAMAIQRVKPDSSARLMGLMARQHEGPGL